LTNSFPVVAMPVLGPYKTETRLESINRCWNLLKNFRYCHHAGLWPSRFTKEGVCQRIILNASHVPDWLRPPENIPERPDEIAKTPAVEAADSLEARDYRIVWDLDIPFNGKAMKPYKTRRLVISRFLAHIRSFQKTHGSLPLPLHSETQSVDSLTVSAHRLTSEHLSCSTLIWHCLKAGLIETYCVTTGSIVRQQMKFDNK
jgi:hypothetical protein